MLCLTVLSPKQPGRGGGNGAGGGLRAETPAYQRLSQDHMGFPAQVLRQQAVSCKQQEAPEASLGCPGSGVVHSAAQPETDPNDPASLSAASAPNRALSSLWTLVPAPAQPVPQADVTAPRPWRPPPAPPPGRRLWSEEGRAAVLAGQPLWAGERGRDKTHRETARKENIQRDAQSETRSQTEEEGTCVCRLAGPMTPASRVLRAGGSCTRLAGH